MSSRYRVTVLSDADGVELRGYVRDADALVALVNAGRRLGWVVIARAVRR